MNKYTIYIILAIIILYIISPLDLHPFVFDDLMASGFLFYFWRKFKNLKSKKTYYSGRQSQTKRNSRSNAGTTNDSSEQMNLNEAYRLLGVSPDVPWSDVQRAYKEKIAKSHPDKVAHLSEELQKKAEALTLEINKAYNIIKGYKKA